MRQICYTSWKSAFTAVLFLNGQCHEIFDFWFFSWISFPQAPEYITRAVSNFFENSRRYSQLKVHHWCRWHRWQMGKIFKNLNYFVWTPLGSIVNIYINFCLQVHFEVSASWYCSHYLPPVIDNDGKLPPVSLTPVSATQAKLVAKFAAGVVDVDDTGGAPWLANISANFQKNLNWS